MTSLPQDISSHAPLIERLRGRAFIPGVHYAIQAGSWMAEAADEIERLHSLIDRLQALLDRQVPS